MRIGENLKILWVKPGKLLPLDTGGKLRTYNILRHLSKDHELTFLSYYGGSRDEKYETEILRHIPGTAAVHTGVADISGFHRNLDYMRRLFSPAPYAVSRFASKRVRTMLVEWMQQQRYDVAVCDFLASAPNFPQDLIIPTVLFQHNVETMLWKRRAEYASTWEDRFIARIEHAKMAFKLLIRLCSLYTSSDRSWLVNALIFLIIHIL